MRSYANFIRLALVGLAFSLSSAIAATVVVGGGITGAGTTSYTVTDASCAALNLGMNAAGFTVIACSSDILVPGSYVMRMTTSTGSTGIVHIVSTDAVAPSSPHPASDYGPFALPLSMGGGAAFIPGSSGGGSGSSSVAVTVKDGFGTATPDQYAAMASVFGAILCAAAAIWGVRRVLVLLSHTAES